MIICIDNKYYTDSSSFDNLDLLIRLIGNGHYWELKENEPEFIMESEWLKNEKGSRAYNKTYELILASIKRSAYVSGKLKNKKQKLFITTQPAQEDSLTLEKAISLLSEKLKIVVESRYSDKNFLISMIKVFNRRVIENEINNNRVEFDHVGGKGEFKKRLREIYQKFGNWRVFALIDSDRRFSKDENIKVKQIIETCEELNIPFHCLNKREIENYLPNEVILQLPKYDPSLELSAKLLLKLSDEQRDFIDMKDGLGKIENEKISLLFSDLDEEQKKQLSKGFENSNCTLNALFIDEIDCINVSNIRKRCHDKPDEISDLLSKIDRII